MAQEIDPRDAALGPAFYGLRSPARDEALSECEHCGGQQIGGYHADAEDKLSDGIGGECIGRSAAGPPMTSSAEEEGSE